MKDNTPYHTRPAGEIDHERRCMHELFKQAPPVKLIYEAFGGIGQAATIWSATHPEARVWSFDADPLCADMYNRRGLRRAQCYTGDALTGLRHVDPKVEWGASLDFNRLTILDLRGRKEGTWKVELIKETLERRPTWCQVTDSAIRYLHLNWKRYKLRSGKPDLYVRALDREFTRQFGYTVAAWNNYYAASYLLLEPKR